MRVLPFLFVIFLLTSVLAVPVPSGHPPNAVPSPSSSGWNIYVVEPAGEIIFPSSIALDSGGYPVMSYHTIDNRYVRIAEWNGNAWSIESAGVTGSNYMGTSSSMALDRSDNIYVGYYYSYPKYDLNYAKRIGGVWSRGPVDSEGDVGDFVSLALDSENEPHISYYDSTEGDLKYAERVGNLWNISAVDTQDDVGRYTSIALDGSDHPHIAYHDFSNFDLRYARWNGTDWSIETVDTAGDVGHGVSIVLDVDGFPHISYSIFADGSIRYASWNGSRWNIETIDVVGLWGSATSIALNEDGDPSLAYSDGEAKVIKYASWNGSAWGIEVVDSGSIGGVGGLVIDEEGVPHLCYRATLKLRYATKAELTPPSHSISLDIDPDTLNLKSKGRWITAYLSAENASVYDINISSILLQDTLEPERYDYQNDVLMLKFSRHEFKNTVAVGESVEVKIAGNWKDGSDFEAYDYIRVINPGKK